MIVFDDRQVMSEDVFEKALWAFLQRIHNIDKSPWDSTVSQNPEDKTFSFSAGGKAFYIVGLHPGSSRKARRFDKPALVFNLHEQFERLREAGQYSHMKGLIKRRDKVFSGSSNPMLEDFGEISEAVQYSGMSHDVSWKCPFHVNISLQ